MGFFDLFKPKWKHSNPEVRKEAVKKLTDQAVLAEIAKNDKEKYVRETAVKNPNLTDQTVLTEIAKNDEYYDVRRAAVEKLINQSLLNEIAKSDKNEYVRIAVVNNPNFSNQTVLADIAKSDKNEYVRMNAMGKLTDLAVLTEIIKNDKNEYIRMVAAEISKNDNDENWELRGCEMGKLSDQAILALKTIAKVEEEHTYQEVHNKEIQNVSFVENHVSLKVFYGTDRNGKVDKKNNWKYDTKRGKLLSLGVCKVSIPKEHKMGEIERPSIFQFEFRENPDKHIVIESVQNLDKELFFQTVTGHIANSQKKEGLIFVHGFNTTFEDAARRTGQLAYDLNIESPFMFSWPSKGKLSPLGYTCDETNVAWALADLRGFIDDIVKRCSFTRIHIIAHSMGNRALAELLCRISERITAETNFKFNQVILAAPDIDAATFQRDIAPRIKNTAQRITIYSSSHDKALKFSKTVHGYPRLGDTDNEFFIAEGMDTVDTSPLETDFFGHTYFASSREVMTDLFMVIKHELPPQDRNLLKKIQRGREYWTFRA